MALLKCLKNKQFALSLMIVLVSGLLVGVPSEQIAKRQKSDYHALVEAENIQPRSIASIEENPKEAEQSFLHESEVNLFERVSIRTQSLVQYRIKK